MVVLPYGPSRVMPGVPGKVAGLADRRLDADLELLGHGDLDLGFLARRAEHADVGDAPLGADQVDLLGAGELAGLRQFVFRRQLVAGAEQRFDVGLRQVHVVGRDLDRDRCVFGLGRQEQLVALDGAQGFPGHQALVVVGDDQDGDRRIVGGDDRNKG
jgi:hypothetical protein